MVRRGDTIIVALKEARAFWALTLLVVASALAVPVRAADIPKEYVEAVRKAEAEGLALYEAEMKGSALEDQAIAEAGGRISTFCDFPYIPVRVTENGEDVLFLLAQPRQNTLSATPTVFHVYLSLKHKIGLDVGTSAGIWAVEHGSITFLQARGSAPAK